MKVWMELDLTVLHVCMWIICLEMLFLFALPQGCCLLSESEWCNDPSNHRISMEHEKRKSYRVCIHFFVLLINDQAPSTINWLIDFSIFYRLLKAKNVIGTYLIRKNSDEVCLSKTYFFSFNSYPIRILKSLGLTG